MPLALQLAIVAAAVIAVALCRDLPALVAVVICANPALLHRHRLGHTRHHCDVEMVYALHGELYHSDRLLLWLPYGTFGQTAEYVTGFACS
jgi:hypothetical protein